MVKIPDHKREWGALPAMPMRVNSRTGPMRVGFSTFISPCPARSAWVYNNDNSSASDCGTNCANNCGNNVRNNVDFRRGVFGSAGSFGHRIGKRNFSVLLTCGTKCGIGLNIGDQCRTTFQIR